MGLSFGFTSSFQAAQMDLESVSDLESEWARALTEAHAGDSGVFQLSGFRVWGFRGSGFGV